MKLSHEAIELLVAEDIKSYPNDSRESLLEYWSNPSNQEEMFEGTKEEINLTAHGSYQ